MKAQSETKGSYLKHENSVPSTKATVVAEQQAFT
jgi:hypothetical protein